MRIIHAFFLVSTLLFVTGVGFVIAGARATRNGPTSSSSTSASPNAGTPAPVVPVATVRQLMSVIVNPAARMVFGSVGTIVTAAGVEERAPSSDADWDDVAANAAALVEAGNLMLMSGRAVDQDGWARYCRALIDGSKSVLEATGKRNAEGVFSASEAIYDSCNGCHQTYQRQ